MDRNLRERRQLRRSFTKSANALETKLNEAKTGVMSMELKTEYEYLTDVAERMFEIDRDIQNLTLDSKELYDERDFEKLFDEAEEYKRRWMSLRLRYEQLIEKAKNDDQRQSQTGSAVTARSCRNLKLPKLELRKFDDDPKNWLGFWGQFKKIHEDMGISDDDKYQYLVQAMKQNSNARELVESFPPSGTSYHKALDHLKSRFAREEVLVETYVRELLRLVLCQAKGDFSLDTRSLYDKLTTYLQALDSLGVSKDKYEAMLYPLVESALPENILLAWSRSLVQRPKGSDQLSQLLEFLRHEVEAEERIRLSRSEFNTQPSSSSYNDSREDTKKKISPTVICLVSADRRDVNKTSCFIHDKTEGKKQTCHFCNKTSHTVLECRKSCEMTLNEKREALKKNAVCFICLKKGHMAKFCRNRAYINCLACGKRHVIVMCPSLHKTKDENIKPKLYSDLGKNLQEPDVSVVTINVQRTCSSPKPQRGRWDFKAKKKKIELLKTATCPKLSKESLIAGQNCRLCYSEYLPNTGSTWYQSTIDRVY